MTSKSDYSMTGKSVSYSMTTKSDYFTTSTSDKFKTRGMKPHLTKRDFDVFLLVTVPGAFGSVNISQRPKKESDCSQKDDRE